MAFNKNPNRESSEHKRKRLIDTLMGAVAVLTLGHGVLSELSFITLPSEVVVALKLGSLTLVVLLVAARFGLDKFWTALYPYIGEYV